MLSHGMLLLYLRNFDVLSYTFLNALFNFNSVNTFQIFVHFEWLRNIRYPYLYTILLPYSFVLTPFTT